MTVLLVIAVLFLAGLGWLAWEVHVAPVLVDPPKEHPVQTRLTDEP